MNGKQAKRLRTLTRQRVTQMAVKHVEEGNDVTTEEILNLTRHLYQQAKLAWKKLSNPKSLLYVDGSSAAQTGASDSEKS